MEFKRFSKDKQEQIRQFVAYAQMCGLSGADIRSIGDKLDRMRRAEERDANKAIIAEYECLYIGDDKPNGTYKASAHEYKLDNRFKLKNANGAYNFQYEWGAYHITSLKTKVKRSHYITNDYELGNITHWGLRARYTVLLDINAGKLVLDF